MGSEGCNLQKNPLQKRAFVNVVNNRLGTVRTACLFQPLMPDPWSSCVQLRLGGHLSEGLLLLTSRNLSFFFAPLDRATRKQAQRIDNDSSQYSQQVATCSTIGLFVFVKVGHVFSILVLAQTRTPFRSCNTHPLLKCRPLIIILWVSGANVYNRPN